MIATSAVRSFSHAGLFLIAGEDLALIIAGVLLLVLGGLVMWWRRRRRPRSDDDDREVIIPLISASPPLSPQPPMPVRPKAGVLEQHAPESGAPAHLPQPRADEWGEEVQRGPVRFRRPPEGTLQLLPGRLVIVSGREALDEIRFVKVPARDAIVTFGRSAGEPHTHIELQSPTVSRKHAAMRFHRGHWHILNLSKTNPVVVRGKQLPLNGPAVRLEDGDQVEMGEVTFRFHAR